MRRRGDRLVDNEARARSEFCADLEYWHYDTFQIHWRSSVAYDLPRGFVTFTIDKDAKTDQLKIDQPNNGFWFYELDLHRTK